MLKKHILHNITTAQNQSPSEYYCSCWKSSSRMLSFTYVCSVRRSAAAVACLSVPSLSMGIKITLKCIDLNRRGHICHCVFAESKFCSVEVDIVMDFFKQNFNYFVLYNLGLNCWHWFWTNVSNIFQRFFSWMNKEMQLVVNSVAVLKLFGSS